MVKDKQKPAPQRQEDQAARWIQTSRVTIALTPVQRETMARLHKVLEASPDAEKPVTPTVIFGVLHELAQESLVNDQIIERRKRKSALELLNEGKDALAAESQAETPAAGGPDDDERGMTSPEPADWRELQFGGKCKGCGKALQAGMLGLARKGFGAIGKDCCEAKVQQFLQGRLDA